MKSKFVRTAGLAIAASLVSLGLAIAAPYAAGSKVEAFTAKDQHEQAFTFEPAATRYLLVSHDMDTGKKANAILTARGKDFLTGKKAVYLANIHGMPGIGRAFALPKMKKYTHRIILGDDADLIAKFPAQKDKVTVLTLKAGKVESVTYWSPGAEELDGVFK